MARVHCLDCATDVVVDPQGVCPSGHHLGVSGERVDEAIGTHTPHPDEPLPWVGIIAPTEVEASPATPVITAPQPQTAPGLAPAAPPPVDTQGLFAELGALGDDEPSTNGHGRVREATPQTTGGFETSGEPEPWPTVPTSAAPTPTPQPSPPADGAPPVNGSEPVNGSGPLHGAGPANGVGAGPVPVNGSAPLSESAPVEDPGAEADPAATGEPAADAGPVRSVPAGGPEAREALSEISALEAAVRSLTDEADASAASPQLEERMFAPAPPPPAPSTSATPPPPAAAAPPASRPAAVPDDQQALRRAAFADVASLGFEPEPPAADPTQAAPEAHAHEPEPEAYQQPQAAGAEGRSTVGLDTMNFTAKGGRMQRSDQRKRRLFGR